MSELTTPDWLKLMQEQHKKDHPTCKYGDEPHFVPPSFGQRGFYLCELDEAKARGEEPDLVNHTRCRPPYDHQHKDH